MSPLPEFWGEKIKLVSFCPSCQATYAKGSSHVLGQDGESQLLHFTCAVCESSFMALIHVNPGGASSIGIATDLSLEDVLRLQGHSRVTADDVLALHTALDRSLWVSAIAGKKEALKPLKIKAKKTS